MGFCSQVAVFTRDSSSVCVEVAMETPYIIVSVVFNEPFVHKP